MGWDGTWGQKMQKIDAAQQKLTVADRSLPNVHLRYTREGVD
jgi:hypothetical protein